MKAIKILIFISQFFLQQFQGNLGKRKLLIMHEISHLRSFMKQNKLIYLNNILMDIFDDINDFFNTFFKIIKTENQKAITIPKNYDKCATTDLQNRKIYRFNFDPDFFWRETRQYVDLVLFFQGEYLQENDIIANAKPCQFDDQNRAIVGKVILNLANFNFSKNQIYAYKNAFNTIIHEIFHIIGFHPKFQIDLPKRIINNKFYPYLSYFIDKTLQQKKVNQSVMNWYAHWTTQILQRDIMNPYERFDLVYTNFTKEYLEYINKGIYRVESFYNQTQDLKEFHAQLISDTLYRCKDHLNSRNKNFCSLKDYQESQNPLNKQQLSKCSYNYKAKAICGQKLSNNCYEKNIIFNKECQNTEKKSVIHGEEFAENSRCFETNYNSICLKTLIENGKVIIEFNKQKYKCQYDYQQIQVDQKIIKCPHLQHFVENSQLNVCENNCYLNGICYKNKCHCMKGYDEQTNCRKRSAPIQKELNMSIKYLKSIVI